MNQGQEKFMSFILERVREDRVSQAKDLLEENFRKQAEGNFTREDILQFIPKMTVLLKSDKIEEVTAVMKQYAGSMGH